jgi:hypothetical protein
LGKNDVRVIDTQGFKANPGVELANAFSVMTQLKLDLANSDLLGNGFTV